MASSLPTGKASRRVRTQDFKAWRIEERGADGKTPSVGGSGNQRSPASRGKGLPGVGAEAPLGLAQTSAAPKPGPEQGCSLLQSPLPPDTKR